jgi:hypothetical protein
MKIHGSLRTLPDQGKECSLQEDFAVAAWRSELELPGIRFHPQNRAAQKDQQNIDRHSGSRRRR